jgi:hypothetical protein
MMVIMNQIIADGQQNLNKRKINAKESQELSRNAAIRSNHELCGKNTVVIFVELDELHQLLNILDVAYSLSRATILRIEGKKASSPVPARRPPALIGHSL